MAFVVDGLAMQWFNRVVAMILKVRGNLPLSDVSQVAQVNAIGSLQCFLSIFWDSAF